jgi:hypothetical protein
MPRRGCLSSKGSCLDEIALRNVVRCYGEEGLNCDCNFSIYLLLHSSMLPGFWGLLQKESKDNSAERERERERENCDQGGSGRKGEGSSQTQIVRVCWIMTQHRCVGQRFFWGSCRELSSHPP